MENEQVPLRSRKNMKMLRFALAGIVLLFLIQLLLYSLESQKVSEIPVIGDNGDSIE